MPIGNELFNLRIGRVIRSLDGNGARLLLLVPVDNNLVIVEAQRDRDVRKETPVVARLREENLVTVLIGVVVLHLIGLVRVATDHDVDAGGVFGDRARGILLKVSGLPLVTLRVEASVGENDDDIRVLLLDLGNVFLDGFDLVAEVEGLNLLAVPAGDAGRDDADHGDLHVVAVGSRLVDEGVGLEVGLAGLLIGDVSAEEREVESALVVLEFVEAVVELMVAHDASIVIEVVVDRRDRVNVTLGVVALVDRLEGGPLVRVAVVEESNSILALVLADLRDRGCEMVHAAKVFRFLRRAERLAREVVVVQRRAVGVGRRKNRDVVDVGSVAVGRERGGARGQKE